MDNLPRIYAAPSVEILASHDQALNALFDEAFEPFQTALVTILPGEAADLAEISLPGATSGEPAFNGEYLVYESDRVVANVSSDRPVMVVFSEMYYPGWEANVDGAPVTLWRANYAFRGVLIEAGEHTIEMEFKPLSFTIGLSISLFSLAVVVLVSVWMGVKGCSQRREKTGMPLPAGDAAPRAPELLDEKSSRATPV